MVVLYGNCSAPPAVAEVLEYLLAQAIKEYPSGDLPLLAIMLTDRF